MKETNIEIGDGRDRDPIALRLTNVTKRFAGLTAVDQVTLEVPSGRRHGIIGPNGAGKTTLFHTITGELKCSSGTVEVFGRNVTQLAPARRVGIGLGRTYQISQAFPTLNVGQNLTLALNGLRRGKYDMFRPWNGRQETNLEIERLANDFNLGDRLDTRASDLSHGELRQLDVALALALRPRLLLLDEPAAGLSPGERRGMEALLQKLPRTLTLIMIEHDMDLITGVVDSLSVLHLGQLVADGPTAAIQQDEYVRDIYLGAAE